MVSKSTPIFKERHIPSIDFKIIKTHFKEVFTKYAEEVNTYFIYGIVGRRRYYLGIR